MRLSAMKFVIPVTSALCPQMWTFFTVPIMAYIMKGGKNMNGGLSKKLFLNGDNGLQQLFKV